MNILNKNPIELNQHEQSKYFIKYLPSWWYLQHFSDYRS
jgi:hypothetical protein